MQMVRPEPKRQLTKKKPQRLVLFGALFSATCVLNFLVLLYYTNPANMSSSLKWVKYTAFNQVVQGSNSDTLIDAQIAQLVEQRTENPRVVGSIPTLGI